MLLWLAVPAIYLLFVSGYLFKDTFWLVRDNLVFQLNNFLYYAGSLEHGYGLPKWLPFGGGSPVGLSAMSWKPFLPHRWIGYFAYSAFNLDYVLAFKISLIAGLMISSIGWYILVRKYLNCSWSALLSTLALFIGGTGVTIYHQEYILSHMQWTPWLILLAMKVYDRPRVLPLLMCALGICMTFDYPHFVMFPVLFFAIGIIAITPARIAQTAAYLWQNKKNTVLGLIILPLVLLPLFYVIKNKDAYASPLRGNASSEYKNLDEYVQRTSSASASKDYLLQYLTPRERVPDDAFAFFVGRLTLALAFLGVIWGGQFALALGVTGAVSLWAIMGIHGFFPQFLFAIHFPFVSLFRQWYHLFPYLNMILCFLAAIGFYELKKSFLGSKMKIAVIAAGLLITLIDGYQYFSLYRNQFLTGYETSFVPSKHLTKSEYLDFVKSDWIHYLEAKETDSNWHRWPGVTLVHFITKSMWDVYFNCEGMKRAGVYSMPDIYSKILKVDPATGAFVLDCGTPEVSIVGDISHNLPITGMCEGNANCSPKLVFDYSKFTVEPNQIRVALDSNNLFVPFSYDLQWSYDKNAISLQPLNNGAFASLKSLGGGNEAILKFPTGLFQYAILVQLMMLLVCLLYVAWPKFAKRRHS